MQQLLGPKGQPISSRDFENKKATPPALGERYGRWAGEQYEVLKLPGGGAIAFDLDNLTLADFRQMKDHYQINSSLAVLTFMLHQMEWHIECEDKKMRDLITENLQDVWSRLVRAKSQALWAGFSPNVLQWENDTQGRRIVLNKVKDLVPEDCAVNWKTVHGPAERGTGVRPSFKVYDGIKQWGAPKPIPVANSYWYPLLMENGDYYGKKLLRSAFQPWFFSSLMHLFANRYYERFGEPLPVGRAPYEDEINVNGTPVKGNILMAQLMQNIRNRSVVVLPNEKTPFGDETSPSHDYQIEYLESQMRGADFERYMTRLDEEMSLALFTPILMMRTADVGSYNLGTQHTLTYYQLVNAVGDDWAHYINKYIVRPLNQYNSSRGERAAPARIKFSRMGKMKPELLQAILTELLKQNAVKFDVRELGEAAGLSLEELDLVVPEDEQPPPPEEQPPGEPQTARLVEAMTERVSKQVVKAFRSGKFDANFTPSLGYKGQLEKAFASANVSEPRQRVEDFYDAAGRWLETMVACGADEYRDAEQFMRLFKSMLDTQMERALS